jgi:uncharacterized membrane protein
MHHWFFFPWFGFFFFFIFIVTMMIMWRRSNGMCFRGANSSLEMLEKRYISGEIDEVEFKNIREHLKR